MLSNTRFVFPIWDGIVTCGTANAFLWCSHCLTVVTRAPFRYWYLYSIDIRCWFYHCFLNILNFCLQIFRLKRHMHLIPKYRFLTYWWWFTISFQLHVLWMQLYYTYELLMHARFLNRSYHLTLRVTWRRWWVSWGCRVYHISRLIIFIAWTYVSINLFVLCISDIYSAK